MAKKAKRTAATKRRARRAIPNPDTVVAEFRFDAPDGQVYRVRRTTQQDEYEETPRSKKSK